MKYLFKLFFLLLAFLLPATAAAMTEYADTTYDFEVDGIYYEILGYNQVAVTYLGVYEIDEDWVHPIPSYTGNVTIPETVTYEGSTYSVTSIADYAFSGCSGLTSVTIPNSVTSIGKEAFWGCSGLNSVTIPNSVTSIGQEAFEYCSGLTSVTIGNSVTTIGNSAFSECTCLTSVTIPNSVTFIDQWAFDGCIDLTSVTIGNSVTSIGDYAFHGCISLASVTIPSSVTSIGDEAFWGCISLASVAIGNSVTSIGNEAFRGCCGLTSIIVDSTNPKFDSRNNCNAIIEKASNTLITGCKNTIIPNTVTSIGDHAFGGCSGLTSVAIPNSITAIGRGAFEGCTSLTSFIIPNSVIAIGRWAFSGCSSLMSVAIPNSVSFIGDYAFERCSGLNDVFSFIVDPTTVSMGYNVFNRYPSNYAERTLHVPIGTSAAYQANTSWNKYFDSIVEMGILATSISLNKTRMTVTVENTLQLTATVLPENATDKSVTWTSSDEVIATVDSTGLVTAIAPGSATITATTTDGTNLSANCAVTVATDYLSIDDTEVFQGDMVMIPVRLNNTESIISFQTDIFLPGGLEIVQEDGDYLIDASDRMTRTHSIVCNDISSGAIRVMCYSSNYKPFTGNSGDDLFYITVKVAEDARGDYNIVLRNTLFTNSDFEEIAAPDVMANVTVNGYKLGDANGSGTITVTDVVVTSQYVLEQNPNPFIFWAADVNADGNITVTDVSRIAWMVLNPTLSAPRRAPVLWNTSDRMGAEGITLAAGETRTVSIALYNTMDYSAFQLDLALPEGLTAGNFRLTDRAGSHAFDVNMLANGKTRALCYSPTLTAIRGNEGAVLTFDVTVTTAVDGAINVDGIELVTTDCQTVHLDAFAVGVNSATSVNEVAAGKTIAKVEYFNVAGQRLDQPESGVTLVVTIYTDGTRSTTKIMK